MDMFARIVGILAEPITEQLELIRLDIRKLMATVQELENKVDALTVGIADMQVRVDEDFQAIRDLLAADAVNQATVDEISAKLDDASAAIGGIDPDPSNPPPTP